MKKFRTFLIFFDLILLLLFGFSYLGKNIKLLFLPSPDELVPTLQQDRPADDTESSIDTQYLDLEEKKIAITFDDGPHAVCTPQLLQGLKDRNVKATFFVTGENAKKHPDIIKQMQEDGHLIGNHTYSHIQLNANNRELFKNELTATSNVIKEITGQETLYVRPPYGSWDKNFEKELNMFPILWDIDPKDWCQTNAAKVVETVCENASENSIILLHDQYESSVTAAFKIIDKLTMEGYQFVSVEELLLD